VVIPSGISVNTQSLVADQMCLEHKWPTYQCIVTTLQETILSVLCCVVILVVCVLAVHSLCRHAVSM
jgi:hypothetical protein